MARVARLLLADRVEPVQMGMRRPRDSGVVAAVACAYPAEPINVASPLRSRLLGDVLRGAEDGAQDILGGISLRAGGDRVSVRLVEVTKAEGVVSYLGVVRCLLQLPNGFVQVNGAVTRRASPATPA